MDDDNGDFISVHTYKPLEEDKPRRKPKKQKFPHRAPTIIDPPKIIYYPTPDKTTCAECTCFPKEEPYTKPKIIKPCQMTPLTLYELSAAAVDELKYPKAFRWSVKQVADWMANVVGLPEYRNCILDNHINGRRLMFLEDPSQMPKINIHYIDHIKMITKKVREAFSTEFIRFCRSIGLPPRKPLTHCTWFKSRTGPSWGIRQNWTRSDVLRWMKIINSEPLHLDHWDLVWHWPPDFPKSMFAGIPRAASQPIPHYQLRELPPCREYMVPRKFRLQHNIPADQQFIWMEHGPGSPAPTDVEMSEEREEVKNEAIKRSLPKAPTIPKPTRLDPPIIDPTGLTGRDLILARRLMPRKKFMS